MKSLGVFRLPVVRAGERFVAGGHLDEIAELLALAPAVHAMLSPAELFARLERILAAAQRYTAAFPNERLAMTVPRREQRDVRQLAYHIFMIPLDMIEAFEGAEYQAGNQPVPDGVRTTAEIVAFASEVRRRFAEWFVAQDDAAWARIFESGYGRHSRHLYLERTTWHSGQHTRQLAALLEAAGVVVSERVSDEVFAGLPIPEGLWE